jgi:hypothetical protein
MAPGKEPMSAIGQEGAPAGGQGAQPGSGSQEFDYQRGYDQLRPEFTRVTQELSQTRDSLNEYEQLFEALHDSDPQVQQAAMEALGLELETGSQGTSQPDEFVDPLEQAVNSLAERFDRLESARELEASQRQESEQILMRDEFIGDAIGIIEGSLGRKLSDREEQVLGNLSVALEDAQGVPNVEAAYNLLYGGDESFVEDVRAQWIASKTDAVVPPLGTTVPADQRPQTPRERIAWMDERMARLESQQ